MKNLTKVRTRAEEEYRAFRAELLEKSKTITSLTALGLLYGMKKQHIDYHLRKARKEAAG